MDTAPEAELGSPVFFNPFEPGFFDNPYDQYRRVREVGAVQPTPIGAWIALDHATCFDVLRRPGTSVAAESANGIAQLMTPEIEEIARNRGERGRHSILNLDPPDHTRLRKLVSKAFTPRTVERLRDRVVELVDQFLDELAETARAGDGTADLIAGFAFPLPFVVISEMLGMPDADRDRLRGWSHTLTRTLEPLTTIEQIREAVVAGDNMLAHLLAAIEWKRANPADDLLTALLHAEDAGDVLTVDELRDQVSTIYIAGHETTVNLIGNGTLALLRNRAQLEQLVADPTLDDNAVEELLRYDSPVQLSRRVMLEPSELGGHALQAGDLVITALGSANHDPARFGDDADQLDLRREDAASHLSFGSGIHHCLGAALARLEGSIAVPRLLRRFPNIEPVSADADWNGRMVLRGLETLQVVLHA